MRFPRNAKIFRGQIDAAPFAGLFFLFVLMLLLYGHNVFIPGIRVQLKEDDTLEPAERTLAIEASGKIEYQGQRYELKKFETRIRGLAQVGKSPTRLRLVVEPAADEELVAYVQRLAQELGITLRPPGNRLEVPAGTGFPGVAGPSVIVGINVNGQIFFQQQVLREEDLQQKLSALAVNEPRLTMILQADKAVSAERLFRLMEIARLAGIADVIMANRPG